MQKIIPYKYIMRSLTIIFSGLVLSWVALFNSYPLVYSDTGTYIAQAIEHWVGWDRPPFYSLFILPLHLGLSLWPIVVVQGAIVAHLIYLSLRAIRCYTSDLSMLAVAVALALGTSLPWHIGQIMPDIFTPVVIMTSFLLGFCGNRLHRYEIYYLVVLASGAIAVHLSHVPLALGLLIVTVAAKAWLGGRDISQCRWILQTSAPLLLAVAGLTSANYAAHGEARLSPYGAIFLLARSLDDGPAKSYMSDACQTKSYSLCPYLSDITTEENFLWSRESPLYKLGGPEVLRAEAEDIVNGTLRSYPLWQLVAALKNTAIQLISVRTGDGLIPYLPGVAPTPTIQRYFLSEHGSYLSSRQMQGGLYLTIFYTVHATILMISIPIAVSGAVWFARHGHIGAVVFFILVCSGLLGNAFITGALSGVFDRYQTRVIWLVPYFAAIAGLCWWDSRRVNARQSYQTHEGSTDGVEPWPASRGRGRRGHCAGSGADP